jgi:hypothetical protein
MVEDASLSPLVQQPTYKQHAHKMSTEPNALGILQLMPAETKLAVITADQLMQPAKPFLQAAQLEPMDSVPTCRPVVILWLKRDVSRDQMDHACGLLDTLTLMDQKELASHIQPARV